MAPCAPPVCLLQPHLLVCPTSLRKQLPIELIISIIELLYIKEDGLTDRRTLRSCSLVCTLWRDPSQRLLLRSFDLDAKKHPLPFLKDIFNNSIRGRFLRSCVRSIFVKTATNEDRRLGGISYSPDECAEILTLFPRLYDLSLDMSYAGIASPDEFMDHFHRAAIECDSFPCIRSFNLYRDPTDSPLLYRFLSLWPTIQFLDVNVHSRLPPSPTLDRPNFVLVQLKLFGVPTLSLLRWLVPDHSLQILDLRWASIHSDALKTFLTQEGTHLRSLRLTFPDLTPDIALLLGLCPNLEELILDSMGDNSDIIRYLPKSLEHVQILYLPFRGPYFCAVTRSLPRLRVFTLTLQQNRDIRKYDTCQELEMECAARGIDLVYSSQRHYLVEDPVVAKHFPRGRSVSNFKLMN